MSTYQFDSRPIFISALVVITDLIMRFRSQILNPTHYQAIFVLSLLIEALFPMVTGVSFALLPYYLLLLL